jgi:tRNA (cmo5U34)-methyltransferase
MTEKHQAEQLFHGAFAEEYHFLQQICPEIIDINQKVAEFVAAWVPPMSASPARPLSLVEIGCGTGMTTQRLLDSRDDIHILAMDNAPAMVSQARANLAPYVAGQRLEIRESDALSALRSLPDDSVDIIASAYALHNFLSGYRSQVLAEIRRVLKPGGVFVNGDRYALDDPALHTADTQAAIRGYFRVFLGEMQRPDLLEQWVIHHISDDSEDHIMRFTLALDDMARQGFSDIKVHSREGVNTLLSSQKPSL